MPLTSPSPWQLWGSPMKIWAPGWKTGRKSVVPDVEVADVHVAAELARRRRVLYAGGGRRLVLGVADELARRGGDRDDPHELVGRDDDVVGEEDDLLAAVHAGPVEVGADVGPDAGREAGRDVGGDVETLVAFAPARVEAVAMTPPVGAVLLKP